MVESRVRVTPQCEECARSWRSERAGIKVSASERDEDLSVDTLDAKRVPSEESKCRGRGG